MVMPNGDEPEDEIEEQPVEYQDLVTEEPEREVYLDDDEYTPNKSVTEAEEEFAQVSDLKAVLNSLTPKFKIERINELTRSAMVSRIFPDNLLDKQKLMVWMLVSEYAEDDADIPIADIIHNVQDALSIGYEGRGIGERLEIGGVAHEEELEKLAKDLGY